MKTALRLLVVLSALAPQLAQACSACMGDPNTNLAKGANAAIFLMLGVLAGMFSLIGAFVYTLYRHSKMAAQSNVDIAETLKAQPEAGH